MLIIINMCTINEAEISSDNKNFVNLINDLGEILNRENSKFYENAIVEIFSLEKCYKTSEYTPDNEKIFLSKIFSILIENINKLNLCPFSGN